MAQIVLDRLRKTVLDERSRGGTPPGETRGRVYVTPSGRVVIDSPEDAEERMLSEVHPAVFA
jgi:hypothetical protein